MVEEFDIDKGVWVEAVMHSSEANALADAAGRLSRQRMVKVVPLIKEEA